MKGTGKTLLRPEQPLFLTSVKLVIVLSHFSIVTLFR
nr:MAG TPA: hypothetical protein [Caudoviricetes sp.]